MGVMGLTMTLFNPKPRMPTWELFVQTFLLIHNSTGVTWIPK